MSKPTGGLLICKLCELFTYILPNKHILCNGNPSVTLFACQLPLHKGAFGAVETCTHLLYLWQAEHLAVHRMQVTGQLPGPTTQEKLANHFDLPVFLFHFSVKNTKQISGAVFVKKRNQTEIDKACSRIPFQPSGSRGCPVRRSGRRGRRG